MSRAATASAAIGFAACGLSAACSSIPPGRDAVDAVEVDGVHGVGKSDLKDKLATTASPRLLGLFRGLVYDYEVFDPYVLRADLQRVERYYRARGFYEARVRAGRVVHTADDHVRVTIVVDEGAPVVVGEVIVEGIEGLPDDLQRKVRRVAEHKGLAPGRRFDEDELAGIAWRIQHVLEDHGYAYAKVERSAQVDLPNHAATIVFVVAPDQPATYGSITITGLGSLPEGPVRRALDLETGESYSARALDHAQQAVLDLGVFSSVAVRAERSDPPPPDRTVPITVEVQPTKLRTIQLGGGVELDLIKTDVHARVGWTDQNFLGGLRRFDVDFRPGVVLYPTRLPDFQAPDRLLPEERSRLQVRQPGIIESRTAGFVRGELNVYPLLITPHLDPSAPVVGYHEARAAVGLDRTFWKLFASLSYNVQLNDPFTYVGDLDPDLQNVVVSYVDLLTNLDFRNDRVRPHAGVFVGNEVQLAGGVMGGDAQDVRVQPQVRGYLPIASATLALRATTGFLFPTNYGDAAQLAPPGQAPPGVDRATWIRDLQLIYFRGFFSGGASSNRGYPVWGVGPHGPVPFFTPGIAAAQIRAECVPGSSTYDDARCAVPLGGLTLWEASAELRMPLSAQIEQASFCDTSDVETGRVRLRFDDPHLSCGVGLRYQTPVGPIRLDVAYRIPGLNPRKGDPDYPGDVLGLPIGVAFGIGEAY
jgi:outer membrane protein insertion porin family/translocation and assembly module TamA